MHKHGMRTDFSSEIDASNSTHVRHWTRAFGCTVRELREAIAEVGAQAAKVRCRFRPRPMTARRHLG
jgi:hypothetical protein